MIAIAGAAWVLLGTVIAALLVPDDAYSTFAMAPPAGVLSAALLVPVAWRLRAGRISSALRAENLLMVGLVYWLLLDLLQGAYELDVAQSTVQLTFAAIGLAGAAIWFAANTGQGRVPQLVRRELQTPWTVVWIFRAAVGCFVLGMLSFAIPSGFDLPLMFSALGESRWSAPWMRGQLGGVDAFWDHLQYFGYALPALYVALARRTGWSSGRALLVLGMAVVVVAFLSQSGGRRIVGVAVGAGILCWLLSAENIRMRVVVGVSVASAALLYFMQQMLLYRAVGWGEDVEPSYSHIHVDDNFLRLAQAIEIVPESHPYVYVQQLVYILVRPIPRLFWPGKPTGPGFDLPSLVGAEGVSLSMSMIGEAYIAFGFVGIALAGLLFGYLSRSVNAMLKLRSEASNPVLVPICLMVLFVGLRSFQDLVIMSYAVLGWLLVSALVSRYRRQRRAAPARSG